MRTLGLIVFLLTACVGGEPFEYVETDEIQAGPGLLTRSEGEWIILEQ